MPPLVLDGTNGVSGVDGTASNPAIEGTDSNTGIFYPAADTVAIGTGGTEALRVNSSQVLSLVNNPTLSGGTANGVAYLNGSKVLTTGSALTFDGTNLTVTGFINNSTSATGNPSAFGATSNGDKFIAINSGAWKAAIGVNGAANMWQQSTDAFLWYLNTSEQMRLTSTGLGIGTSSPSYKLDVDKGSAGLVARFKGGTRSAYIYSDNDAVYFTSDTSVATAFGVNETSDILTFFTNNAERARIDSQGRMIVGATGSVSSGGRLQSVQSEQSSAALSVDATNSSYDYNVAYLNTTRASSTAFYFISCTTGNYGTHQFRVRGDGTLYAQNTTVQSLSDVRVKENIRDSEDGLQVVLGLQPRRFDFKQGFGNDRKNVLGFIAQEIEVVFPDAVDITPVDPDGEGPEDPYKSVGPGALIPVLVKAIQELNAKVEAQAAEIAALKGNA